MDKQEFTQKANDLLFSMDKASKLLNRYLDAVKEGHEYRSKYFKKRYAYVENYIETAFPALVNEAAHVQ